MQNVVTRSLSLINGEMHNSEIGRHFPELCEDSIIIYAGFIRQSMYMFDNSEVEVCRNYLRENYRPGMNILFDCLLEGVVAPVVRTIHKIIDDIVDPASVYYFTSAVNGEFLYNRFADAASIHNRINIRTAIIWDEHAYETAARFAPEYDSGKLKDRIFLCLNRVARTHRLALLGMMFDRDLVDKGYYSYLHSTHGKNSTPEIEKFITTVGYEFSSEITDIVRAQVSKNINRLPLKLNIEPDHNATYIMDSDIDYYQNSYFSLVSETFFYNQEPSVFFSEKIFKPIAMKHPFIVVGSPDMLKTLRELGYKTFGPIIDEKYDGIQNVNERLTAIVDEVARLSKNSDQQWAEWQELAKPIVEHNYRVLQEAVERYRKR